MIDIPRLGLGTYKLVGQDGRRAISDALEIGYRHIDTAQMYGNEIEVGEAVTASGIDRADLFITTKLNNPFHAPDDARREINNSLQRLKTDYVDLLLIHWPMAKTTDYVATWRVLMEFAASGQAKNIGVSNFLVNHLQTLIDQTGVTPAVNQIELQPYLQQNEIVEFNQAHGIQTESWSPLGKTNIFDDPVLNQIADELGASVAQVVLAWHLQKGFVVIPKSANRRRQAENFASRQIQLNADQMTRIGQLDRGLRYGVHPDDIELR